MSGKDIAKSAWDFIAKVGREVASTAVASVRQTTTELSQQVLPAFPDSVKPMPDMGMPGVVTSREAYEQKHAERGSIYGKEVTKEAEPAKDVSKQKQMEPEL